MRGNPTPGSAGSNPRWALATGLVLAVSAMPLVGLEMERIIPLAPGGTRGATEMPKQFVLNPLRNRLYCLGSAGWAVVIDCAENRIVGDMPVPPPAGSPALWSATCRTAYFLTDLGIVVVDGAADTIRATIPTPVRCWNAAFDDTNCCLVASMPESSRILVVCGGGDTIIRQLRTTRSPLWVAWNSVSNRYNTLAVKSWGDSCYMTVFDAASGAVLDSFPLDVVGAQALVYTPLSNKVYVGTDSTLIAIDGSSNQILKRLPFSTNHLVWSRPGNKLYCCYNDTVRVVDCATDSVLKLLILPSSVATSCTTLSNRVWFSGDSAVYVVDAAVDSIIAVVRPHGWTYNGEEECVYGVDYARSFLVAIDEPSCQSGDTIGAGFEVMDVCCNPKLNKLYARDLIWDGANSAISSITVVDQANGQMLKRLRTGLSKGFDALMVLDPGLDKLYCPNSDDATITVVDCLHDSIIKTIPVAPEPHYLAVNVTDNKLYCAHCVWPAQVTVVDCKTDSVVAVIPLPSPDWAYSVWWHVGVNKAYVYHYGGIFTVIDGRTNQVVGEFGPYPNVHSIACDTRHNRLYIPSPFSGLGPGLYALDAVGDTVVDSFPQLNCGEWVVWNECADKVYYFGRTQPPEPSWAIGVIDCTSDSFLRILPRPRGYTMSNEPPPASHPTEPRAYFYAFSDTAPEPRGGAGIWTIECDSDTIAGFARFAPESYVTSRLCVDGTRNLVFANGLSRVYVMRDHIPGVTDEVPGPERHLVLECTPNPMKGRLTVRVRLPDGQAAKLAVYDRAGVVVRTLAAHRTDHQASLQWDGRDEQGRETPAGVYFLCLAAGNVRLSQKVIRLR